MSDDNSDSELDLLFQAMLEQELDEQQARRLEGILLSDARAREDYLRLTELDHLLQLAYHKSEESRTELTVKPVRRPIRKSPVLWVAWGLISVATVCLLLILNRQPSNEVVEAPRAVAAIELATAATLTNSMAALWGETAESRQLPIGTQWAPDDWIELEKGAVILTLANGVKCAVTGEALFKIDNDLNCFLDFGTVTFDVPSGASGFTVHTQGGSFIDVGTTFGVEVSDKGRSEVHVIKGIVNARTAESKANGSRRLRLTSGTAAGLNAATGQLATTAFRPEKFSAPLAFLAGVESYAGPLAFWSQPLETIAPEQRWNAQYGWLCQERSSVVLRQRLDLAVSKNASQSGAERQVIPAGTALRSFLLHFTHHDPLATKVLNGSITFDSRIAAIVVSPEDLAMTDSIFCFPQTDRNVNDVTKQRRGSNEPMDQVAIVPGSNRTIQFRLSSNGLPNLDQVRILVMDDATTGM